MSNFIMCNVNVKTNLLCAGHFVKIILSAGMCSDRGTDGGWGHGLRGAEMQGRVEGRALTRIQASAREGGRLSRAEHEKTSHHGGTPFLNRFIIDCVGNGTRKGGGAERQRAGTRLEREIGSQRAMYVAEIERNRESERRQTGRNKQQVAKTTDRHTKS
jgi:hypothetical protein